MSVRFAAVRKIFRWKKSGENLPVSTEPKGPSFLQRMGTSFVTYLKNLHEDYRAVAVETVETARKKKIRTMFYLSAVGTFIYAWGSNPDLNDYERVLAWYRIQCGYVSEGIRSRKADEYLRRMSLLENQRRLHRTDLILCSLLREKQFDARCDLYPKECPPLKSSWWDLAALRREVVDFGVFGMWWWTEKAMKDYDVNEEEWE